MDFYFTIHNLMYVKKYIRKHELNLFTTFISHKYNVNKIFMTQVENKLLNSGIIR